MVSSMVIIREDKKREGESQISMWVCLMPVGCLIVLMKRSSQDTNLTPRLGSLLSTYPTVELHLFLFYSVCFSASFSICLSSHSWPRSGVALVQDDRMSCKGTQLIRLCMGQRGDASMVHRVYGLFGPRVALDSTWDNHSSTSAYQKCSKAFQKRILPTRGVLKLTRRVQWPTREESGKTVVTWANYKQVGLLEGHVGQPEVSTKGSMKQHLC